MRHYTKLALVVTLFALVFGPKGRAQIQAQFVAQPGATLDYLQTSGFYYPIKPLGGLGLVGYHRLGGFPSGPGFGGHFMSPDGSQLDPQFKLDNSRQYGQYLPTGVYHNGMDIMADYGTPVYAIADGQVSSRNTYSTDSWSTIGDTCKQAACTKNIGLVLNHYTNTNMMFEAVYGHMELATVDPALLHTGASVRAGQYLGKVGSWSAGNHLHFGIYPNINGRSAPVNGATTGWGRDAMSNWPQSLGWTDPVLFIESNCSSLVGYCNTPVEVAKSDMKEILIGKFQPTLFTYDGYYYPITTISDGYDHYGMWFYLTQSDGQLHWYIANEITWRNNRAIRYVAIGDYNSQTGTVAWQPGWHMVTVIP